jgi:hypothetical protein
MESSARLNLKEAVGAYDNEEYDLAFKQAVRSIDYSVGVFHPDYKKAMK